MTLWLFACTWLLLLSGIVTSSSGELEFYPDAVPETSQDITLKQLARFLQSYHQRGGHRRARLSPLLPSHVYKKNHLGLNLEERYAQLLRDMFNPELRLKVPSIWGYQYPSYEKESRIKLLEKYPYFDETFSLDKDQDDNVNYNEELAYPRGKISSKQSYGTAIVGKGMNEMKEPSLSSFHEGHFGREEEEDEEEEDEEVDRDSVHYRMPLITYQFDPPDLEDKHPFAVKPNDPRYYQKPPFSVDDNENKFDDESLENDMKSDEDKTRSEKDAIDVMRDSDNTGVQGKFAEIMTDSTTESDRYTEFHPLIVPVEHSFNPDIIFIALVAGCSAVVMFALVLIVLTWCRLQRGVKAAADIEYPAYGVTGPNKDVSPSGDQRLAQSAQMYHFQHQKQQIIAMENRTSATRDPGSVSEADSDEENEEGDYTVYECPGLASTGEMEVKNPLFHDDPTPATPAQTNKEEDHI